MYDALMREQAQKHIAMSEDELYMLLVPEHIRQQLYSRDGLLSRGKVIFASVLKDAREAVCPKYAEQAGRVEKVIDLTVILAVALSEAPSFADIPVFPMAALIVKIGLEEFCRGFGSHDV